MKSIKVNQIILTLVLIAFARVGIAADQLNLELLNFSCVKNTIEFDMYLNNVGESNLHIAALTCGINLNKELQNGGSLSARISSSDKNLRSASNLKFSISPIEVDKRIQIKIASEVLSYLSSIQLLPNSEIFVAHATIYNSVEWNKDEIHNAYLQLSYQMGLASAQAMVYNELSQESKVLSMMTDDLHASIHSTKGKIGNSTSSDATTLASNDNSNNEFTLFTYPNPVTDNLNIHFETKSRMESNEICITDLLGRNLICQNLNKQEMVDKQMLIPATFPNGSYLIQLNTDGKVRFHQKLILNRN